MIDKSSRRHAILNAFGRILTVSALDELSGFGDASLVGVGSRPLVDPTRCPVEAGARGKKRQAAAEHDTAADAPYGPDHGPARSTAPDSGCLAGCFRHGVDVHVPIRTCARQRRSAGLSNLPLTTDGDQAAKATKAARTKPANDPHARARASGLVRLQKASRPHPTSDQKRNTTDATPQVATASWRCYQTNPGLESVAASPRNLGQRSRAARRVPVLSVPGLR